MRMCDRCGSRNKVQYISSVGTILVDVDLCEECIEKFFKWLNYVTPI